MNSLTFHLNNGVSVVLPLGDCPGQISRPYFLVANIMVQAVKTNEMVKPGIEYPAPKPANRSPNRCEKCPSNDGAHPSANDGYDERRLV